MRRRAAGILALAISLAATRGARAQTFYLGGAATDTAVGLAVGTEIQLPVRATIPSSYFVSSTRLTFHYDPNALDVLGVLPVGFSSIADSSTGVGSFTVSASGCGGTGDELLQLQVKLKTGAIHGAYLWATADSTRSWYYYCGYSQAGFTFTTSIAQLCTATQIYGDVDGDGEVQSRDALITLSAAVGLPVTGFDLANGDVDGDGLTNSRDALIMLSYAIGLNPGGSRVGLGIPAGCPGLSPPGEKLVLRARGSSTLYDTVAVIAANATTLTMVPGPFQPVGPRLAADGVSIVTTCSVYYIGLCRVQTDGSGFYERLGNDGDYGAPDWNPAGDSIAFVKYVSGARWPTVMDSGGGHLRSLSANGAPYYKYAGTIAWNRTGTLIAYVRSDGTIWTVAPDSTADAQVPISGVTDAQWVRWSPGNDSLAFTRASVPGIWVVAASGGTPVARTTFASYGQVSGLVMGFDWGPQGMIFPSEVPGQMGLWLLAPTGVISRVTSGPHVEPSFRRNP